MSQHYTNVMVAVDGSKSAELALNRGINVAKRNKARLTIAHVVDTRAMQSVTAFDVEIYNIAQEDAQKFMDDYEQKAREAGVEDVKQVIEFGNPKTLLATEIPDKENVDLILVGATGLNAFERLLVGSSSQYILIHAKVDLLIVRDDNKTFYTNND